LYDMSHSIICMTCVTNNRVLSHTSTSHVTHVIQTIESYPTHQRVMSHMSFK